MVVATFWHVHLPFCTVFAIYVALQPLILYDICCMLVRTSNIPFTWYLLHVGIYLTLSCCMVLLHVCCHCSGCCDCCGCCDVGSAGVWTSKKICFLEVGSQYLCSIEPRKVRSIQTGENKAKQRDRSRERVRDQKYIFQIKKIKTRIAKNLQK